MEEINMFTVGELVAMSKGAYSDYCVNGLFRVVKEFDAQEQLEVWVKETGRVVNKHGDVESDYRQENITDEINFLAWLSRNEFIEDVTYRGLHLGDYGETCLEDYTGHHEGG